MKRIWKMFLILKKSRKEPRRKASTNLYAVLKHTRKCQKLTTDYRFRGIPSPDVG